MTCYQVSASVNSSRHQHQKRSGVTARRSRLCHTFFLAVLCAPFWTFSTDAGRIRPRDSRILGQGYHGLNEARQWDNYCGLTTADPIPPASLIRVGIPRAAGKKSLVNDTDPMDDFFHRGIVSEFQSGGIQASNTVHSLSPLICSTQTVTRGWQVSTDQTSVPQCSPFHLLILIQFFVYGFLSYMTKGRSFTNRRSFLLLLCGTVVLPVCALQSDRFLHTRLLGVSAKKYGSLWKSIPWSPVKISVLIHRHLRASRNGTPFDPGGHVFYDAQIIDGLFDLAFSSPWVPWDKTPRLGEAMNPGPNVDFETLNIASAGKNQNTILEETLTPAVRVFTETCLTKLVYETIIKKAKACKKYILPGALCTPRQHMVKAASQTRGQSGGVLVSTDLAARPSSVEIPVATWASTRVVDAVIAITSTLQVRVIGFYGITAKYHKNYVELNDNILQSVLSRVMQSTLPCVIMGDFNCCLEDMPFWGRLSDWGWKDAAILNYERTGEPPLMTFKGETRIDYILIPPQLLQFVKDFRVQPETVSDHAMVSLRLAFPGDQLKVQVWKTCRDPEVIFRQCPAGSIPETEIDVEFNTRVTQGQMALAFRRFVDNYEQRIARAYKHTDLLVPLASFCGRSKPKLVLKPFHCPMVGSGTENIRARWTTRP